MAIRLLKICFVASISLLCLFYAAQNVANLDACYQAFAYVMGLTAGGRLRAGPSTSSAPASP